MKNTIFITILYIFLYTTLYAQKDSIDFYYYKGEKIFLQQSTDKIFIRFEPYLSDIQIEAFINGDTSMFISETFFDNTVYCFAILETKNGKSIPPTTIEYFKKIEEVISVVPLFQYNNGYQGLMDEFIVKLKSNTSFMELRELAENYNCRVGEENKYVKNQFMIHALKASPLNALQLSNLIYETGLFDYAEPNFVIFNPFQSFDLYFDEQWGLKNTGQNGWTQGIDIKIEQAWTITEGNPNIRIAVIDNGVDLTHPDLEDNLLPGYDETGYNTGGAPVITNINSYHGTACAGIIGAIKDNEIGIVGVAPHCKMIPIRNYGANSTYEQAANGIHSAWKNGADILSNSWHSLSSSNSITAAIDSAVIYGRNGLGCVFVFASGNYDNYHNMNQTVRYPACLSNVIAVGAISPCGERKYCPKDISCPSRNYLCDGEDWWGSCFGPELDLIAPGVIIYTTDIQGSDGANPESSTEGDYYCCFNGTSSACPHVAGVAALVLSVNPELTGQQVRNIIESTAQKIRTDLYNYTDNALHPNGTWHQEMGYGLVDAYAAVVAARCYNGLPIVHGTITQNTTWNTDVHAIGNITIPNGINLSITSTVKCDHEASILIHPGGKLILDGGTLTNACNGEMWQGITVMGDPNLPSSTLFQGYVHQGKKIFFQPSV